jgi:hypothetical protein
MKGKDLRRERGIIDYVARRQQQRNLWEGWFMLQI